jgi:glycosyltransferase involved in cell wall biosynthesis
MDKVAREPGIELTMAAPRFLHGDLRPIPLEPGPADPPYRLVPVPAHFTGRIHVFLYRGLRAVAPRGAHDILFAWEEPYILAGYQTARVAAKARARYAFWTAQNLPKRYPPPFSHFERYCVGHADGWLACGHLVRQTQLARGYPDRLNRVTHMAVDESRFYPDPAARDAMRRRLGLEGPVIGYLGRLSVSKGMELLCKAMEEVPAPWTLLVVGAGPYREELVAWAGRRGLSDRLRLASATHDEVPDYLRAMDLLLAPSQTMPNWKEQFGRMVAEGFACGVPVLSSDSAELPYVVGDAGLVLPEADPAAWTESIAGLLDSPERRRALSEAGLARYRECYTSERVARIYVDFFRDLADQAPNR